ncbi:MAG: tRNA glutamyl-Q synthetase [Flavobacteriales bacterium]|nr:tRNA glutamyl-Q synthetase [Flavobacteriales bacterium]
MVLPALPAGLRTRIAPTPSGPLHLGNGAAFVLTWKLARAAGGRILLRIDDLDAERARPGHVEDIFRSLEWLGIDWDEGPTGPGDFAKNGSQHLRLDGYAALLDRLKDTGLVYACSCTRTTMASCTCRAQGLPLETPDVLWRLGLEGGGPVSMRIWPDGSDLLEPSALMPDPVIRQRSVRPAYQVASLADDLDAGINFIVRGADLLPSTACQLFMAKYLGERGFQEAAFVHHKLLTDARGAKLSKSAGAGSLHDMRSAGVDPQLVHQQADRLLAELLGQA